MKNTLLPLFVIVLLSAACDDMVIRGETARCTTSNPSCGAWATNTDIGEKEYGYVEMDFSIENPFLTATQSGVGIQLRASGVSNYYSCRIGPQTGIGITPQTSKIIFSIVGLNPPGASFTGATVISNQFTSSFIGDHTLGCELVLVGGTSKTIRLYLDGILSTSYILGSNSDDLGPLTSSTGKVGFFVFDTQPSTENIKLSDFRYYQTKP